MKFRSRLPDGRRLRSPLQRRDVEPLRRRRARSFENDRVLDGLGTRFHGSVVVAAVEQQPHRISIFVPGELGSFVFHKPVVVARIFCWIGVPLQCLPDAVLPPRARRSCRFVSGPFSDEKTAATPWRG